MYKYAMMYELRPKDNSKYVDILKNKKQNPNARDRNPFSKKNIDLFWSMKEDKWYQIPLILIYTGLRIGELLELEKENIELKAQVEELKAYRIKWEGHLESLRAQSGVDTQKLPEKNKLAS